MLKPVEFVGGSQEAIRSFPRLARTAAGWQLQQVQLGKEPADWKPMPDVGIGVKELRIHRPHEHRVIYVAHFSEAIYVLAAFEKKTERTPKRYLDRARKAYAQIREIRKETSQS
jgi:phage-related protein